LSTGTNIMFITNSEYIDHNQTYNLLTLVIT
jgi:hypothetical protein